MAQLSRFTRIAEVKFAGGQLAVGNLGVGRVVGVVGTEDLRKSKVGAAVSTVGKLVGLDVGMEVLAEVGGTVGAVG